MRLRRWSSRLARAVTLIALASGIVPAPARAQREPMSVHAGLVTVQAPSAGFSAAQALAEHVPRVLADAEAALGVRLAGRVTVSLVLPRAPLDSLLNAVDAEVAPWAAGYTMPARRWIVIRTAESSRWPYGTVTSVLAHELAHQLIHDAVGRTVPRWAEEGIATWQGRRWTLSDAWLWSGTLMTGDVPRFAETDSAFLGAEGDAERAYASSYAFIAWMVRREGESFPRDLLAAARTRPFPAAWRSVAGESFERSESQWRRSALVRYRWLPLAFSATGLWAIVSLAFAGAGAWRRARQLQERRRLPDEDEVAIDALAPRDPSGAIAERAGDSPPAEG